MIETLPAVDGQRARQREQYEAQGYLHVPQILSRDLVKRLAELMRGAFEAQAQLFERDTGVQLDSPAQLQRFLDQQSDPDAWFRAQPRATQHLVRGEFPLEVRLREEFLQLADESALTELLQVLLGDERLRLHYPPMLRFKVPGMDQAKVPLHQDGPYFPHLQQFANVWIPLCPITPQCGGVNVLEGSHRLGPLQHAEATLWGNYVSPEALGTRFPDHHILMEPGDVLIFGPHLLHYTHSNTSDRVRYSIDSRWFDSATATTRQYFDLATSEVVRMF